MGRRKREVAPRPLTKKQRTRVQREARMNRWIIGGVIAVCVVVVGVLVYGYLVEGVFKAREPVATVNGVTITSADFEDRVRMRRLMLQRELLNSRLQRMALDSTDPQMAPFLEQMEASIRSLEQQLLPENAVGIGSQVLGLMTQEELVRQEAARRGIVVSQEEIDLAIEKEFGYDRDAEAQAVATPSGPLTATESVTATSVVTRGGFEQSYQDYVESIVEPSGVGEQGFRALVEASLLYDQVRAAIVEGIPVEGDQVQVRYIAFTLEEDAADMVERLDAGEAWEDIAAEIEADESAAAVVVPEAWRTKPYLTAEFGIQFAETIFETPVGAYTQPLLGTVPEYAYYFVAQVSAREERELDPVMMSYGREQRFQEWIDGQMEGVDYSDDWQEKVPTLP
jgi:hypothetical protein